MVIQILRTTRSDGKETTNRSEFGTSLFCLTRRNLGHVTWTLSRALRLAPEEVGHELVVPHQPLTARPLPQPPSVYVHLRQLKQKIRVLVVRAQRQRRDQLFGCRVVLALKVVAVWHVAQLGRFDCAHLNRGQALGGDLT